jgi:hypothetical protein
MTAFLRSKKFWKRTVFIALVLPMLLFVTAIAIVYFNQQKIAQHILEEVNSGIRGRVTMSYSSVAPFADFPYITVDLHDVRLFKDKQTNVEPIADIDHVFVGFDIWSVTAGTFELGAIKLKNGKLLIIQHKDGTTNVANVFESLEVDTASTTAGTKIDLRSVKLDSVDVHKINEATGLQVDALIHQAKAGVSMSDDHFDVELDAKSTVTILMEDDTTFLHDKHVDLITGIRIDHKKGKLDFDHSIVKIEGAEIEMKGGVDLLDDINMNLTFEGNKPNFELFMAFAPPELQPFLAQYDNRGKIYFNCSLKGKTLNGQQPAINAKFGCEQAYFANTNTNKKLDQMHFAGSFTNGDSLNLSTMEFRLNDFFAKPDAGEFSGDLVVKNFEAPDIDLSLKSDFDLEFLTKFLNVESLQNLKGRVLLSMKFHDLIDPKHPERSVEKLNESYETELTVSKLSFKSPDFYLPLQNLDLKAHMDGHTALIDYCNVQVGNSDVSLSGSVSDLPAIIHHTSDQVESKLRISSKKLDLFQLTSNDTVNKKPFKEVIRNFSMGLHFVSSAKAFTESPNLPIGEFFIDNLYADMQNYPHRLHDFHADVIIDTIDFNVIDFTGIIDESDFHFNGKLSRYDMWFMEHPKGDTRLEFDLTSKLLQLDNLFSYNGANYVPEDWRHEELRGFKFHGHADLHFNEGLQSTDLYMDRVDASLKVHPLKLERFSGRFHLEQEQLTVTSCQGKAGKSDWKMDMDYFLGKDEKKRKKKDRLVFQSGVLDFDELFSYVPEKAEAREGSAHDSVFNIYTVPFPDVDYQFSIGRMNYHKYLLTGVNAKLHTTKNHYLYIDTLSMGIAGGTMHMNGYFDGTDPKKIYFNPIIKTDKVQLDQLLFKFDNFGQDYVLSNNLHGQLTSTITGKIRTHADLVPILEESDISIGATVYNGRLENYAPFEALAPYFPDKNLKQVRFDTLSNTFQVKNGKLIIPNMTINSTLGYLQMDGEQEMVGQGLMNYHFRIPMSMVTEVSKNAIFGKKGQDSGGDDEIQYMEYDKNVRFLHIQMTGTSDNLQVKPVRPKKKKK